MHVHGYHGAGRPRAHGRPFIEDGGDPTGTATLRRKFMRASDKRWRAACRLVMEAVGNGDLLGLGQPNLNSVALRARHGGMAGTDPVTGFRHWLDNLLRDVVVGHDGSWLAPFVSSAEELAAKRARDIGVSVPPPSMSMTMPHRALVLSELHALATLGVQRGTRAAASALASRQRPQAAARRIVAALREAMLRSRMMTDYAVSKAFTGTMINHFRAAGITKVGIVPERLRRRRVGVRDKDVALEADTEEDVVGFCTQEGDLVCQECQDAAEAGPYTLDEIDGLIPLHPNAVLEGTTIASYGAVHEMVRAKFRGPAVYLRTGAKLFAIGPNHPVLTRRGFVPARNLNEGDQLLYDLRTDPPAAPRRADHANLEQMPLVENMFGALFAASPRSLMATSHHDFHGDGIFCERKIDVVHPARQLLPIFDARGLQKICKFMLVRSDGELMLETILGRLQLPFRRMLASSYRVVRGFNLVPALTFGHAGPFDGFLFRGSASRNTGSPEDAVDGGSACAEIDSDTVDALALFVERNNDVFRWDRILDVRHGQFSGLAFDASTATGIYNSAGYIVKNCRCFPCPTEDVDISPAAKELLGLGAVSRAEAGALGLGAVAGVLAPELPAGVASAAELGEPEEGEEEGLGAGGVVAAALGLGAAAAGAAGLLGGKRRREEPEESEEEAPMPAIKEPVDYPEEFAGHTAAEYTAYVNRWLDWALENGWTDDMVGERWDDEEALRDKVGMTPEQEEALLQRVDEVASLVEK